MIPHPSFVVYPMIVQAVGGIRVVVTLKDYRIDLEAMARAMTPMTKMVFIANPNNPTATIVTADEVDHFMARVPDRAIVVFDEAYLEFAQGPDFPDTLNYLRHGRKVVILRTFSKAASLAGLRVGLRHGRSGLRGAPEPHPAAVQRELHRAGRGARRTG